MEGVRGRWWGSESPGGLKGRRGASGGDGRRQGVTEGGSPGKLQGQQEATESPARGSNDTD